MRIYLDTNIIMEFLGHRACYDDVNAILKAAEQNVIEAVISSNSLDTIIYLLGVQLKVQGVHEPEKRQVVREMVKGLLKFIDVVSISREMVIEALDDENFNDIEDGIQYYCSVENDCDVLLTINTKHFKSASKNVSVVNPADFVARYIKET